MTTTRTILIRPKHWDDAKRIFTVFCRPPYSNAAGVPTLEKILQLAEGDYLRMTIGISCGTCKAMPGSRCTTATGRVTYRPHKERYVTVLAAVFAVLEETTIVEEPEIEDVLTGT